MIKRFVKRGTEEDAEAIRLSPQTLNAVLNWTGGFEVKEIDPEDETVTYSAVLYDFGGQRKRVTEGQWLVYFRGEFFAATTDSFNQRFEPRP